MVQNTKNARRGKSVGRGASRGVGRNVSGEATPEGVANIPMGREDNSQTGTNSQADTRDVRLNSFLKGKPPQFGGDFNPEGAEKWLQEIKKIFSFTRCIENRRVSYTTFMLTDDDEAWWRG
ncbi:hypothetical protein KIW84_012441 [Lathyrus oleraceus]|uniref:Uncharacterized protein n=1 Tax=Pisum sativum TaxID=3888 RepID=A0A9D5GWR6_PEA|nr:hypothetical protein KIW84_012441 [Pisum sativum]